MTTEHLETIIQQALEKVRELLGELEQHIREAAAKALSDTQDSESGGKPKVIIPMKLTIELNTSPPSFSFAASVTVKHTACSEVAQIDDGTQELDFDGEGGDKS